MATVTGQPMEKIVNWFMLLIIFVFDPLAIAMVVAANMAFAYVKGVARDPKDYEVYKQSLHTNEEATIEDESKSIIPKVKEVIKYKDNPVLQNSRVKDAIKHARRAGELK
jgi:DNA primase large subunit